MVDVQLVALTGTDQVGTVGQDLPIPLVVQVRDEAHDDAPIPNAPVMFGIETGGGTIRLAEGGMAAGNGASLVTRTDGSGKASSLLTLGPTAGIQTIRVSTAYPVSGDSTLVVSLSALVGPVGRVLRSGDGQVGAAGQVLPLNVGVVVTDEFGNPVGGVTVTWTVSVGGGTLDPASAPTTDAGWAGTRWTLGAAGPQELLAEIGGVGLFDFRATAK